MGRLRALSGRHRFDSMVLPVYWAPLPAPIREPALETITCLTRELIAHGAVDGATGDALDRLIDTWLEQWRAQLTRDLLERQAETRGRIVLAQHRVATAQAQAKATLRAHDAAQAVYAFCVAKAAVVPKQVSNGVHSPAAH